MKAIVLEGTKQEIKWMLQGLEIEKTVVVKKDAGKVDEKKTVVKDNVRKRKRVGERGRSLRVPNANKRWTKTELATIREFAMNSDNHYTSGRLRLKKLKQLAKAMRRSPAAIYGKLQMNNWLYNDVKGTKRESPKRKK